jgi:hypothetical protein
VDAALEAFKLVGFDDIYLPMEKEREDLIFEFNYGSRYKSFFFLPVRRLLFLLR